MHARFNSRVKLLPRVKFSIERVRALRNVIRKKYFISGLESLERHVVLCYDEELALSPLLRALSWEKKGNRRSQRPLWYGGLVEVGWVSLASCLLPRFDINAH